MRVRPRGCLSWVQAAAAAWRKQAALRWHAAHGRQPPEEQQALLEPLLAELQDAAGIAGMQEQLEAAAEEQQQQQQQPAESPPQPPEQATPQPATARPAGVHMSAFVPERAAPADAWRTVLASAAGSLQAIAAVPANGLQQDRAAGAQHMSPREHASQAAPASLTSHSPQPTPRDALPRHQEGARAGSSRPAQLPSGPEPCLAPALVRHHTGPRAGTSEWLLTSRTVFLAGLQRGIDEQAAQALVEGLARGVGAKGGLGELPGWLGTGPGDRPAAAAGAWIPLRAASCCPMALSSGEPALLFAAPPAIFNH